MNDDRSAIINEGKVHNTALQTIHICVTCQRPGEALPPGEQAGQQLYQAIAARAAQAGARLHVAPVACMANCKRSCTVAFAAPGKWTYILGEIDPGIAGMADAVLACAALQAESPDGTISYFKRPEILRKGTIARVPSLSLGAELS